MALEKKNYIEYIDLVTLVVCIVGMMLSRFLINLGMVMLIARVLFIGSWKEKLENIMQNKVILITALSFIALHLVGLFWSENLKYGFGDISKKAALFIIPLCLAMIPLRKEIIKYLYWSFILVLFVGATWGGIVYFSSINPDTRGLIFSSSHIRFSLNLCFGIISLLYILIRQYKSLKTWIRVISIFMVSYFFAYMIISQAMTGLVILFLFIIVYTPYYLIKYKKNLVSYSILSLYVIVISTSSIWIYFQYSYYFTPNKIYQTNISKITPDGEKYTELFNVKSIENGNYIYHYFCYKEVSQEWKKKTGIDANDKLVKKDGSKSTNTYLDILVRYMNSKNPIKNARTFNELSNEDIENIKLGIENVVYTEKFSLKPRLYKIFYQINCFKEYKTIKNFSELQRIELWTNAAALIKENPLFGVGTGDIADKFEQKLKERNSQLYLSKLRTHNEYLTILLTFGIIGFALFMFWLVYPAYKQRLFYNFIYFTFFFILCVSMTTEDTLDNVAGIMFFVLVNYIFLFNTKEINEL